MSTTTHHGHGAVPEDFTSKHPAPVSSDDSSDSDNPKEGIDTVKEWKPTKELYIIIFTMCVIVLAVAFDATSLSVALPIMAQKLGGSAIQAFWAGTSFLLTSTVFQPLTGSLSTIFGRKPLIYVTLLLFTVGSIMAGVANNFTVILVGRCIQGVGGGGVVTCTEVLLTDLVPLRYRGQYFGFFSMMWAIGTVTGPVIGGAFAQKASWRWIFYFNLFFAGAGFILVPIFLRLKQVPSSIQEKLAKVDWIGAFIFIGSVTSILIPISWGGVMYDWDHAKTVTPLVIGFVGLIGFIAYEYYIPAQPMIPLRLFYNRTAAVSYLGTFLHGIILWSFLYYLPLYYQAIKGYSPIMSGVALFPQTFTVAPASIVVGILITIYGKYRWSIWVGWTLTILGCGILALLDLDTKVVEWIFLNLVSGIGTGMLFPSLGYAVQASAEPQDVAFAVAMFSFFRAFGQAFGVAIGGVIFQNALSSKLSQFPALKEVAGEYAKDAVALVEVIKHMPEGELRDQLMWSYSEGLKPVWYAMTGFAAFAGIMSLLTREVSIDVELKTEQGLKEKKKKTVPEEEGVREKR